MKEIGFRTAGIDNLEIDFYFMREPVIREVNRRLWIEDGERKAVEVLDEDEIKLEDFRGIYADEVLSRDADLVERRKQERLGEPAQSIEARKLATILEAIIHTQVKDGKWFGDNATSIRVSKYDDLENQVDQVAEFRERAMSSLLALGVDVTLKAGLERKLAGIRAAILSGELAHLKYFRNSDGSFKGQYRKIPRVVVAISHDQLQELAELWLNNKQDELAKHPAQLQILAEIMMQAEAFAKFAEQHGKTQVREKYLHIKDIIESILKEKAGQITARHNLDAAFRELQADLKEFNQL